MIPARGREIRSDEGIHSRRNDRPEAEVLPVVNESKVFSIFRVA